MQVPAECLTVHRGRAADLRVIFNMFYMHNYHESLYLYLGLVSTFNYINASLCMYVSQFELWGRLSYVLDPPSIVISCYPLPCEVETVPQVFYLNKGIRTEY